MAETTYADLMKLRAAAQGQIWQNFLVQPDVKPSIFRRVFNALTGGAYATCAFGGDVSHWDAQRIAAIQKGDFDFLIGKIGGTDGGALYTDSTWPQVVQLAYDYDIPAFGFQFAGPIYWIKTLNYSLETLKAISDDKNPVLQMIIQQLHAGAGWKACYGVFMDDEEASLDDQGLNPAARQVSPDWLMWEAKRYLEGLENIGHPHLITGVYSRNNFMVGLAAPGRNLSTYLGTQPNKKIWEARWFNPATAPANLQQARAIRPPDTMRPAGFGYTVPDRPKTWDLWQIGIFAGYDCNLYNGTAQQLYDAVQYVPRGTVPVPNPPPPVTDPTVAAAIKALQDVQIVQAAQILALQDGHAALNTSVQTLERDDANLTQWARGINYNPPAG
jgi:hypothetical protein